MVFLYTDGSIAKGLTKNKFLGLKGIRETRKRHLLECGKCCERKKSLLNEMHINFVKYMYHLCQWQLDLLKHKLNLLLLFS